MIIIFSLIFFITLCYVIQILLLWIGFLNLSGNDSHVNSDINLFISVVVPFRNESEGLPVLIKAFTDQSMPPEQYEVIFVDDHSTDGSAEIAGRACKQNPNFKLLQLTEDEQGKKRAIAHGVSLAAGSYIIQTDADSRFERNFLEEYAAKIQNSSADLIAGPVTYDYNRSSFIEILETIDFMSLTGTGAGSFYYNNPIMCSGANLCFRKSLYFEASKFDPAGKTPSGDDMFLLIAAKKLNKKITYLKSFRAIVFTRPAGTLKPFLHQRIRWGSKTPYYADRDIIWIAILVTLTNIALLLSPLLILYWHDLWKEIVLCIGLKSIADFVLLFATGRFMGQTSLLWFYPLVAVLHYFYFVYIAFASVFSRIHWRGRVY